MSDDKEARATWVREEVAEKREVLNELFDYYGLARDDWMRLAWALIDDHVPAMERSEKPGRRAEWDDVTRALLRVDTDDTIARKAGGMSRSSALAIVAKRDPWKARVRKSKNPVDLLTKQYDQASDLWVDLVRKARAYETYTADPNKDLDAAIRAAGLPSE